MTVNKAKIQARIYDGKCYNFALGFVNDWQFQKGYFNPDESKSLSHELSQEIQRTIESFFKGLTKTVTR